ncbi:DUF4416 family protein [Candidatus Woesearchaeota archaeon]|nr:DUF4416 family protein [Candidatus Woesearchaeota archaeon]
MAQPVFPEKAKLVMGIMYSDKDTYEKSINVLVNKFGKIDNISNEFDFDFTDYYNEEFGSNLKKRFVSFEKLIEIEALPEIKLFTNGIEKKLLLNNKRTVNIDPGYLTKDKLIVASCKPRPHRIYLGKGVYAHIMFFFSKKDIISFRWTFADYLLKGNIEFFLGLRNELIIKNKDN